MFPLPLSRTVDSALSLGCSFHRNHDHHWEIALYAVLEIRLLQCSTRWLWSALWSTLGSTPPSMLGRPLATLSTVRDGQEGHLKRGSSVLGPLILT